MQTQEGAAVKCHMFWWCFCSLWNMSLHQIICVYKYSVAWKWRILTAIPVPRVQGYLYMFQYSRRVWGVHKHWGLAIILQQPGVWSTSFSNSTHRATGQIQFTITNACLSFHCVKIPFHFTLKHLHHICWITHKCMQKNKIRKIQKYHIAAVLVLEQENRVYAY